MKKLGKYELQQVSGGGITFGMGALIVAGVVFLTGVIDGYFRPLRCN